MKRLFALLLLVSATASANQKLIVEGNYLRYEGAEYESAFFPCYSTEVWTIDGGNAYHALVDFYRNSQTNENGEIRASLELIVSPIDRTEYPDSHFDISQDENEINSCR